MPYGLVHRVREQRLAGHSFTGDCKPEGGSRRISPARTEATGQSRRTAGAGSSVQVLSAWLHATASPPPPAQHPAHLTDIDEPTGSLRLAAGKCVQSPRKSGAVARTS